MQTTATQAVAFIRVNDCELGRAAEAIRRFGGEPTPWRTVAFEDGSEMAVRNLRWTEITR